MFHLVEQPKSIVIKGGGYIAVEFACIFAGLGTRQRWSIAATISCAASTATLPSISGRDGKEEINIILDANIARVRGQWCIEESDNRQWRSARCRPVMLAVGRLPNTKGLGLEKAGVVTDRIGDIRVDQYSRSSIRHILAVEQT
ncbi:MAG: FAD-dependent oxidoreductase [Nitratireductor sp.]